MVAPRISFGRLACLRRGCRTTINRLSKLYPRALGSGLITTAVLRSFEKRAAVHPKSTGLTCEVDLISTSVGAIRCIRMQHSNIQLQVCQSGMADGFCARISMRRGVEDRFREHVSVEEHGDASTLKSGIGEYLGRLQTVPTLSQCSQSDLLDRLVRKASPTASEERPRRVVRLAITQQSHGAHNLFRYPLQTRVQAPEL
jgi:hypothetical protein